MKITFNQWFKLKESGFTNQSMPDPPEELTPMGSEITSNPYWSKAEDPPIKKQKKKQKKN